MIEHSPENQIAALCTLLGERAQGLVKLRDYGRYRIYQVVSRLLHDERLAIITCYQKPDKYCLHLCQAQSSKPTPTLTTYMITFLF